MQIVLTFLLTVLLSYAVVHVVSYLPGAEFVTGYRRKDKKKK